MMRMHRRKKKDMTISVHQGWRQSNCYLRQIAQHQVQVLWIL